MIPCKKIKCLRFPICKSKARIVCTPLKDFYLESIGDADGEQLMNEVNTIWLIIHDHLPHCSVIDPESISGGAGPILFPNRGEYK